MMERLSGDELEKLIDAGRSGGAPVVIVDVRDEDRAAGWIAGSRHMPSTSLTEDKLAALAAEVSKMSPVTTVIFHCMLSQVRGPTACQRYNRIPGARAKVLTGGFQMFGQTVGRRRPDLVEGL